MKINDSNNCLVILPYAGGDARSFYKLAAQLNEEVFVIEYAGHGKRISEELNSSFFDFFSDVCNSIEKIRNGRPITLLGYSLGSILAYEYYAKFPDRVKNLILCSRQSPLFDSTETKRSSLGDDDLCTEILNMGGTDARLLYTDDFNFYFNIIKNDFRVVDDYNQLTHPIVKINCPLQVNVGLNDTDFSLKQANEWRKFIDENGYYEINIFQGGHFFFKKNIHSFANVINAFIEH